MAPNVTKLRFSTASFGVGKFRNFGLSNYVVPGVDGSEGEVRLMFWWEGGLECLKSDAEKFTMGIGVEEDGF